MTVSITIDIIIYAKWSAKKYTVTLNVNGGDELTEKEIEVEYDKEYESFPTPSRTGYTFLGWFTDGNELIANEMTVNITTNVTIHAQWTDLPTELVEIIFGVKDLSVENITAFLKEYTDGDFTIEHIEKINGETKAIIKFNDAKKGIELFGAINELVDDDGLVKGIIFKREIKDASLSVGRSSFTLFNILLI